MAEAAKEEKVTKQQLQDLLERIKREAKSELSPTRALRRSVCPASIGLGMGALLAVGTYFLLRPRGDDAHPRVGRCGATFVALGAGVAGAAAGTVVAKRLGW